MIGRTQLAEVEKDNVQKIRQIYEAIANGEMERALADVAPDIVVYEPDSLPYGGRFEGYAGVAEYFQKIAAVWDDFKMTPTDFLDAGDTIIAVVQLTGRAKESGAMLDMPMYDFWRLRDGKAVEARAVPADTAKILEILSK